MSKDLKDLINTVEEDTKSHAELEQNIRSLNEEINRLNKTITEQRLLINNLRNQMKDEQIERAELPSEIDVLKEIISSQRQELNAKDDNIDALNDKIIELTENLEMGDNINLGNISSDDYNEAQELLEQLTDENEQYKDQIALLQHQLEDLQSEKSDSEEHLDDEIQAKLNEELINFKRLNFQLMEQNGLLRLEIESLKAKQKEKGGLENLEELEIANMKIQILTSEVEDLEEQIKFLNDSVLKSSEPVIVSTEEALKFSKLREEFEDTKSELLKLQKENEALNQILNELKEKEVIVEEKDYELPKIQGLTKTLKKSLFFRMYNLLHEDDKNRIINYLIQDLKNGNYLIKRNTIRILSLLKSEKIYNAFLEMVDDKDWIVRYGIIKALSTFEDKNAELKILFEHFSTDADIDVRELAQKILKNYSE